MTVDFSPDPILNAIEQYRGTLTDLDASTPAAQVVDAVRFAHGRKLLSDELRQAGLKSGQRVVMAISNGPLFPAMLWAVLEAGGTPLLVHFELPPLELLRTAERIGASHIVCNNWHRDDFAQSELSAASIDLDWVQCTTVHVPESRWHEDANYPALPGVPLHPTSGTTGQPKMAIRPGQAAIQEAHHYVETMDIDANDTILCVVPMSHAYGYGMGNMVSMLTNANLVTMRRFNPRQVLRAMREHTPSIFPAVPAMLDLLCLAAGNNSPVSPRRVLSAGAPLTEQTASRFLERFGTLTQPLYGTTETGGISVGVGDDLPTITGCVGRPMNGVATQLRAVDDQKGQQQDDDQNGLERLYIKSSSMMAGYLRTSGIDTSPLEGGWFETGDLARFHSSGAILLKGRQTEVINVFGLKVLPLEVEEAIRLMPEVVETKVYAGRHRSGSQIIKAAVVCQGEVGESQVRAHCLQHLAPFKQPERITMMEALPRSSMGKILSDQLP
ncbi:MAG: long-chain fatty acid--CoA ligase [Planctomycetes bacterium]|nr:long-chain fatty acid--CoA ligase [Planctomycetota bacterium]